MSRQSSALLRGLPSLFGLIDQETRDHVLEQVQRLILPLRRVEERIRSFVEDSIAGVQSSDPEGLRQALYGLENNWVSDVSAKSILDTFPEYCRWRGTRKGLEILLAAYLGETHFEILERRFPGRPIRLGQARLGANQRLNAAGTVVNSLCVVIKDDEHPTTPQQRTMLRRLLRTELPVGLTAYVQSHETRRAQAPVTSRKRILDQWGYRL